MLITVALPGRAPYRATVITSTGEYVKEGRVTPVTVSAADPQRIWIEYDPFFRADHL
jgi:hypothetical protein